MNRILDWFQGNLSDKTTWVAICGVIVAFTNFTMTSDQIAAIAALGAILFTVRDKHIVAAGNKITRLCSRKAKSIQEPDEHETLDDLISRGRK